MNWLWHGNSEVVFKTSDERKKSKLKRSILIFLGSAVVVVLLAAFFLLLSYDFDLKNVIGNTGTVVEGEENKYTIKNVSGEENILMYCTDDDETVVKFICAVKFNMNKKEISVFPISSTDKIFKYNNTDVNASECYKKAGILQLVQSAGQYMGVEFGKYIGCKEGSIEGITANFDELEVTFEDDMTFKMDADSISFKKGKSVVTDDVIVKLLTYPAGEETDKFRANLLLQMFRQYFNESSLENRNMIYSDIINQTDSNISVVDFASYKDVIVVLSSEKVRKKYTVASSVQDFRE